MNPYVALALAIGLEVVGTTALKFVDGFTNPLPSAAVLVGLLWFDERLDLAAVVGVGLIVLGVYVLNVVSDVSAH